MNQNVIRLSLLSAMPLVLMACYTARYDTQPDASQQVEPGSVAYADRSSQTDQSAINRSVGVTASSQSGAVQSDTQVSGGISAQATYGSPSTAPAYGPASTQPSYGASSTAPAYGPASTQPSYGASSTAPAYGPASTQPSYGASSTAPSIEQPSTRPSNSTSVVTPPAEEPFIQRSDGSQAYSQTYGQTSVQSPSGASGTVSLNRQTSTDQSTRSSSTTVGVSTGTLINQPAVQENARTYPDINQGSTASSEEVPMSPPSSTLDSPASSGSVQNRALASKPLDLNTATVAELRRVPGVSYTLAQAIVAYRNKSGKFQSTDELLRVTGMSPAKLSAIRPYITVQNSTSSEF